MEFVSLEISGFRRYETLTSFNFKNINNDYIFDSDSRSKIFLLEAILGIIFGYDQEEKQVFRGDESINKTFTGLVTLELDERIMMIERDFETNFVACLLSDMKTTRPIFQGKDFVGNGYSRPYLQMLKSIFPITDKQLIKEICLDEAISEEKSFADLLSVLYILFTPKFKFSSTKFLINDSRRLIDEYENFALKAHAAERLYLQKKTLKHLIKLQKNIDQLSGDYDQLKRLIHKLNKNIKKHRVKENPNDPFAALRGFNPLQARADILMWKSLIQKKQKYEEQFNTLMERKERISQIIDHDLYEYSKLPEEFSKDISRLKTLFKQLDDQKNKLKEQKNEIRLLEGRLSRHNLLKRMLLALVPPVIFIISYLLLGPFWVLIIPETLLSFFIVLFIYGHSTYKLRAKIYHIQEESHIREKRIHDYSKEAEDTQTRFPLLQEKEYIESHLERFKKYQRFQTELRRINREEDNLRKNLHSPALKGQLPQFEQKYSNAVDINRSDLEAYLDAFVEKSPEPQTEQEPIGSSPVVSELKSLENIYLKNINELKTIWRELSQVISRANEDQENDLAQALDRVDQTIKNIHFENRVSFSA